LTTPYRGYSEPKIAVTVPSGASLEAIAELLQSRGAIRHAWLLKSIFRWNGTEAQSKAGEYVFDRPMTPLEVYEKLLKGEVQYRVITVPEGFDLFDIGALLQAKEMAKEPEFRQVLQSPETIRQLKEIDPSLEQPEGFLFPETYFLARQEGAAKLVALMLREFQRNYGEFERQRASALGMSTLQVVTLASLIEKESGLPQERPLISGVFHNRLKRSMLLQCDPTIIYALLLNGRYRGEIYRSDLTFPSPYNTYIYPGLPPGPICSPGKQSLQAALYPQETDKMYFVSRNDGSHYFSATLQEHNRAVQQYQRN
jgi:UPF0755 protein